MTKVMTVVGTRPELIRLSEVIKLLDNSCSHVLVHTGQNYDFELNGVFFRDLEIRDPTTSSRSTHRLWARCLPASSSAWKTSSPGNGPMPCLSLATRTAASAH